MRRLNNHPIIPSYASSITVDSTFIKNAVTIFLSIKKENDDKFEIEDFIPYVAAYKFNLNGSTFSMSNMEIEKALEKQFLNQNKKVIFYDFLPNFPGGKVYFLHKRATTSIVSSSLPKKKRRYQSQEMRA